MELGGGIHTVDVRDERYEVCHCSETEEMPNQVENKGVGWNGRQKSKAADRSRR